MSTNYDIYRVKLEKIHERTGYYDNELFIFTFPVIDSEINVRPFEGWMEKKKHPLSKVSQACRALMGRNFNIFVEDQNLLIGQECYVKVEGRKIIDFISIADYEAEKEGVYHG